MPELAISADKICAAIETLREIGGMDDAQPGSTLESGDDSPVASLEERADDPRRDEIAEFARGLSGDERIDLIALVLLGREEYAIEEWEEARREARDRLAETGPRLVPELLIGDPAMPEFLEAGLQCFGRSCADWDAEIIAPAPEGLAGGLPQPEDPGWAAGPSDIGDVAQAQSPGLPPAIDRHLIAGAASPESAAPEARQTPEGMLGDETIEQNLDQRGHPRAAITRDEVEAAFSAGKPGAAPKSEKKRGGRKKKQPRRPRRR
jgi:Protein of unknown function (DUF3775)